MWPTVGAVVDLAHATLMALWVVGLPLLFVRRWPRISQVYALFAIAYILVNQVSYYLLGECILTTLSRAAWERAAIAIGAHSPTREWFTVRLAQAVFGLSPSHRSIKLMSEALIFITAVGTAISLRRARSTARAQ
jgi:hypothetical protein